MKFLSLILIFLFIPSRIEAQSEGIIHATVASYGVAAFVDTATTEYGLGKGIVHEANPIQKYFTDNGPVVAGIAKGSMHITIGYFLLRYHQEHPKIIFWTTALLTGAQVWVDYSNAKVIKNGIR